MKKTKKKLDLIDRAEVVKMLEWRIANNIGWLEEALSDKEYFVAAQTSSNIGILGLVLDDVKGY
jgi:hypothetical protein